MKVGRVTGTVVATIQDPVFDGKRLLVCDLVDLEGRATGEYLIAVDAVDAGFDEMVLLLDEGNSARQVVGQDPAPVRAVVVGVVDELTVAGSEVPGSRGAEG